MTNQVNNLCLIPSTDVIQLTLTLKMTTTQVVERQSLSTTTVLFRTTFTQTIIHNNWNTFADISTIDISCTESKRKYGKQHSCLEDFMGYALKEEVDELLPPPPPFPLSRKNEERKKKNMRIAKMPFIRWQLPFEECLLELTSLHNLKLQGFWIGRGKKVKFYRIFRANSQKNWPISQESLGNFRDKHHGKTICRKWLILWEFSGQILLEINQFSTDLTSILNVLFF